jgi:uncharacterized protein (DUF488 family)
MKVFTIGFAGKSAEEFFSKLIDARVKRLVDIRLRNVSQMAGFTKRDDLRYFCRAICGIEYLHLPVLAPTDDILDETKKRGGSWENYVTRFSRLIAERRIEEQVDRKTLDGACLLCSEADPEQCHRRLVAEYLKKKWGDLEIHHIV